VSPLAFVHPRAVLGEGCAVAPFAHIDAGATIGARTCLGPHVCIGPNAVIGEDCLLHAHVVVYEGCVLGSRVTLHAGCVIGQDGFGYATHGEPGQAPVHHKFPQTGGVVVEDDVEMGANCAIDRAALGVTRIGQGTKFSNLVTVGHGSRVGRHNLVVAQVGLAGSVRTGDNVVIGGQAGIAGHLRVADRVRIAARAGVIDNLDQPGESYGGEPAMPFTRFKRAALSMLRLPQLLEEVRELRQRVKALESRERDGPPSA
jgi:UDP-3-O-[3-hydroxymyristoyl] glucosamine N-acyltransferase